MNEEPFSFEMRKELGSPEEQRAIMARVWDLISPFFSAGDNRQDIAEFERLLNEDLHLALNVFYAMTTVAGLIMREADQEDVDPLDVLRQFAERMERRIDGD